MSARRKTNRTSSNAKVVLLLLLLVVLLLLLLLLVVLIPLKSVSDRTLKWGIFERRWVAAGKRVAAGK